MRAALVEFAAQMHAPLAPCDQRADAEQSVRRLLLEERVGCTHSIFLQSTRSGHAAEFVHPWGLATSPVVARLKSSRSLNRLRLIKSMEQLQQRDLRLVDVRDPERVGATNVLVREPSARNGSCATCPSTFASTSPASASASSTAHRGR
jgi:hypothetical protein